jgi:hypothetical protein
MANSIIIIFLLQISFIFWHNLRDTALFKKNFKSKPQLKVLSVANEKDWDYYQEYYYDSKRLEFGSVAPLCVCPAPFFEVECPPPPLCEYEYEDYDYYSEDEDEFLSSL